MIDIFSEKFEIIENNISEEYIDIFAKRISREIVRKIFDINKRIADAELSVEKANNLAIGNVGFFKKIFTNQEKKQIQSKLEALGESGIKLFELIQEQFELQQEAIRLTQVSCLLSDQMSIHLSQVITNGLSDTNGSVIKVDENTKKIITILVDNAKKYTAEQAKIECAHVRLNLKDKIDSEQNNLLKQHHRKLQNLKLEQDKKRLIDENQEYKITNNTANIQLMNNKLIDQDRINKQIHKYLAELSNKIIVQQNIIDEQSNVINELKQENQIFTKKLLGLKNEQVNKHSEFIEKIVLFKNFIKIAKISLCLIFIVMVLNFYFILTK